MASGLTTSTAMRRTSWVRDPNTHMRGTEASLTQRFSEKLKVNHDLDRRLVSFQANKTETEHRWYKYKEGFSAPLIRYILSHIGPHRGRLLDPFAGSGTALFCASELGVDSVGIELLPIGAEIVEVRKFLLEADRGKLAREIKKFSEGRLWEEEGPRQPFRHLRITEGAFPRETERKLGRYLHEVAEIRDKTVSRLLRLAALCVLEEISFTRKDGQYLRWDSRSGRRAGENGFHKGPILEFTRAISAKLDEISVDLQSNGLPFSQPPPPLGRAGIELLRGSCLDVLPKLPRGSFDGIITSPPYCNRYDYTRTYALELAMLGVDEVGISNLRQAMLSCTVENREKPGLDADLSPGLFVKARHAVQSQPLLEEVLSYLDRCKLDGSLNNNGIPRMVRNYFLELALVIFECARVLKPGAPLVMVNDNVRYQGAPIPVDLILSDIAEKAGLEVDEIWILPRGKGNSSQQMGAHGREELRKGVYVWSKRPTRALARSGE